jgi:hypothetical protein
MPSICQEARYLAFPITQRSIWARGICQKARFCPFYIPGAHDERSSCGKIVLVMRTTFLAIREGEEGFLENTHWLKGHKGTEEDRKGQHFSHFFPPPPRWPLLRLSKTEVKAGQGKSKQKN